jgi:hypothetical protein
MESMSGFARYCVTGWSARFGYWVTDMYECTNMESAKKRFITQYPTLKQIKVYLLREA